MEKKRERIKGLMIVLIMLACFLIIPLVSASLYDELEAMKSRYCRIEDYGKVSFSKTNLINKFNLLGYDFSCVFILDYAPFDTDIENHFNYGEIRQISWNGKDYIILLGESESALEEVVNLVANYENHKLLLRGENVIFYLDNYFRLYEQGEEFILPPHSNCTDQEGAHLYTGNKGTIGIGENVTAFNSYCIDEGLLAFPYCKNDRLATEMYNCNCVVDKCVATSSEVFYWLTQLEEYKVTRGFVYDSIQSWIDNPEVSYIPYTPITMTSPPSSTQSSTGGAAPSTIFTETIPVSQIEFEEGYSRTLSEAEKLEVEVEGESHYVGVVEVTDTTVTIEVASDPKKEVLFVGDSKKFDVTGDNFYDIYVQLNEIENKKADLTVKGIYERISANDVETPGKATRDPSKMWMWLILIVVVIVAVIMVIMLKKKEITNS